MICEVLGSFEFDYDDKLENNLFFMFIHLGEAAWDDELGCLFSYRSSSLEYVISKHVLISEIQELTPSSDVHIFYGILELNLTLANLVRGSIATLT